MFPFRRNPSRLCIVGIIVGPAFLLTSLAAGQISQEAPAIASAPKTGTHDSSAMLIGGGDLLQVTVYGTDFDRQARVSDGGEISLPLLGTIKVAGLTIEQAEQSVGRQLTEKGYFNNPQVSIFDKEYATQGISVLGEVQKPGIYPLVGARTLFDAISAAGGTTEKAGNSVIITHRNHPDAPQSVPLSYVGESSIHSNVRVLPGDTVVVSKAAIVYVVGDVHKPSGILIQNSRITALQAVAMAEGTNPTAALNGAKLIRKTPQGIQEIPLPLKKILSAKAPDWPLQPDDILFVPTSTAKAATRRGLEAIIQAATGAAIYRPY
jgi:polysaccharide biosynthesis/export protein